MKKSYIITAAQSYASPHTNLLNGLKKYAERNNSELIVLPMIGNSARQDWDGIKDMFQEFLEYNKRKLNSNIRIGQHHIRPYMIDPITGLNRFAQRGTSLIVGSPKQRMRAIAHSNHKIPKLIMSTGAVTRPNYATGNDISAERRRLGGIALEDHTYGALVVEVINGNKYHLRNIRADSRGRFIDLGKKFDGKKRVGNADLEALVFGDWHNGYTDKKVRKANFEMIEEYNPKKVVLHDFFDGHSVSHHAKGHLITQLMLEGSDKGFLSLEDELKLSYNELIEINKRMKRRDKEIYVVAANHLEFLDRYLDEGRFIKDPGNARLAFHLAAALAEDKNPVEVGIKMMGNLPKSIKFLRRDEDLKVRGYQLGSHGDKGPSGGRGSIKSRENDFGKSITGHSHSAEILRDTYIVGTSTPLTIFYSRGTPTKWTNTNALLWENGMVQMVHIINGKWRDK